MGEVLEVDTSDDQLARGKWMRVKVNINTNKLIKQGKCSTEEGGKVWFFLNTRGC